MPRHVAQAPSYSTRCTRADRGGTHTHTHTHIGIEASDHGQRRLHVVASDQLCEVGGGDCCVEGLFVRRNPLPQCDWLLAGSRLLASKQKGVTKALTVYFTAPPPMSTVLARRRGFAALVRCCPVAAYARTEGRGTVLRLQRCPARRVQCQRLVQLMIGMMTAHSSPRGCCLPGAVTEWATAVGPVALAQRLQGRC